MNINQLKYVIEVSAASSMREASRKLYISQPALSNSIKELEKIVDNNIRIINNCIDLTYEDIIIKMYENYRQVFALNGNVYPF